MPNNTSPTARTRSGAKPQPLASAKLFPLPADHICDRIFECWLDELARGRFSGSTLAVRERMARRYSAEHIAYILHFKLQAMRSETAVLKTVIQTAPAMAREAVADVRADFLQSKAVSAGARL